MVKNIFAAGLAWSLCAIAGAQAGPGLYIPGHTIKDQGITLSSWGSGTISETDEVAFEGNTSVRIFSRNFFQGGILSFTRPIDVSKSYDDLNDLLQITFRTAETAMTIPAAGAQPARSDQGGGRGGRGRGAGELLFHAPSTGVAVGQPAQRGRLGEAATTSQGRQTGGGLGQAPTLAPVENLRIIVTTTDDLRSEFYVPISDSFAGERGWRNIAFPLSAISGLGRTNKIIKEIALSADGQVTIFIGGVRIVNDTTPISGDVNVSTLNLGQDEKVELRARGFAGSTLLTYDWDFDDRDGIQVDATGPVVTRVFHKPGTYTITVTIRDQFGRKKAVTKTITATVNP